MRNERVRWIVALTIVLAIAPVTGTLTVDAERSNEFVAGEGQANQPAPPGVTDGTLESPPELLDAHTSLLVEAGFAANGTTNVTVIRQSVLVDVQRTANRTVSANATTYRQTQRSVARAPIGTVVREEDFWGNESAEIQRRVEGQETSYNVTEPKPRPRLAARTVLGPYLRSANFTVTDTANASERLATVRADGEPIGGERRYRLRATNLTNTTRIENRLPNGATNARNFSATAVLDEDGRVHEFEARLEYTIMEDDRTHTVTFALQELGVETVARPTWVDERRGDTGNETGAETESGALIGESGRYPGTPGVNAGVGPRVGNVGDGPTELSTSNTATPSFR